MPHDGQTAPASPLLSGLTTLTAAALPEVEALFIEAREALRARVTQGGKISSAALETEQYAAHALSWLATYTEALRQLNAWAGRLADQGSLGQMESLILQIGFGEYLAQIAGGIPMSQTETARLSDLGLSWVPGAEAATLIAAGNTPAARSALVACMKNRLLSWTLSFSSGVMRTPMLVGLAMA